MSESTFKDKIDPSDIQVMVVDDEECIRETLHELLSSEGISVVTVTGADECLRTLREGFRGVILMDIMMPGRDGWETIREIEAAGLMEGNVISMLTAMDVPDERMEGLQEYVIDYIVKPFDPTEFLVIIRKYLALQQQIRSVS